jgi:hypothetical protein
MKFNKRYNMNSNLNYVSNKKPKVIFYKHNNLEAIQNNKLFLKVIAQMKKFLIISKNSFQVLT